MRARVPFALLTLLLAGCGLGPGEERSGAGAALRVTRDFGRERLHTAKLERVREGETVMRFLRSSVRVKTRHGGRFVQAIDGVAGRGSVGRTDWFYFVNGVEAGVGAAEYELSPGDVVHWDYRRWDAAMRVPAIVGAFPEPLRRGLRGKRFPVRVECEDATSFPCREVKRRLRTLGVKATGASLGAPFTRNLARVIVARWTAARAVPGTPTLEEGPQRSGVFARFSRGGRALELLDGAGKTARVAPASTGLVAALAPSEDEIVWLVTALDERGLSAAARALDERTLRDAYSVALGPEGPLKLPLERR